MSISHGPVHTNVRPAHTLKKKCKGSALLGLSPLLTHGIQGQAQVETPQTSNSQQLRQQLAPLQKRPASQGGLRGAARKIPPRKVPERTLEKFLERQQTGTWALRREASLLQQEMVRANQEEYDVQYWGAHGADGFRKKLISVYGTIPTAWRVALDKNDSGKLSFNEFCSQCKEIGFGGNLKKVWKDLDADGDGFVTMKDLDSDAHQAIASFMTLLLTKYGSSIAGWKHGLDVAGTHRLEEKDFVERCAAIGYEADAKKLFRLLRVDPHNKCITLKEIDPQAALALKSGDPCAEAYAEGGRSSPSRSPEPRAFSRQGARSINNSSTMFTSTETVPEDSQVVLPLEILEASPPRSPSNGSPTASPTARSPSNGLRQHRSLGQLRPMPLGSTEDRPSSSSSMNRCMSETGLWSPQASTPLSKRPHLGAVTPTRTSNWIRELSNHQRAMGAERKQKQDDADMGVKTLAGFRTVLVARYGNMLAAWRQVLDIHDKGRLCSGDFFEALQRVGYTGSKKAIWAELDPNSLGYVSLKELDPKLDSIIREYKDLVRQKYGTLVAGWIAGLDTISSGRVEEAPFVEHCKLLGFSGDAKQLFRTLQSDPRSKFLVIRDWDLRASRAHARGDVGMITEFHAPDVAKTPTHELNFHERQEKSFHQQWSRFQASQKLEDLDKTFKEAEALDVGSHDLASFKKNMIGKYGSLTTAWRRGLDPEGLQHLPFNEFATVLRKQGYSGNVKKLWQELDPENVGYVTLKSFHPEADSELGFFRAQLVQKFGDLCTAWREGLDPAHIGRLEEDQFLKAFKKLSLEGSGKGIFAHLHERGRSFITLKDIEPKAVDAHYRGDHKASTLIKHHGDKHVEAHLAATSALPSPQASVSASEGITLSPAELAEGFSTPQEQLSPTGSTMRTSTASTMNQTGPRSTRLSDWSQELGQRMRHETVRMQKEEKDQWMGCISLEGFRQLLSARYGSTVSAWRTVLLGCDGDGNGRLSFSEFCKGCRCISFHGNVKELWALLGGDAVGHITLEALDPEAGRGLRLLREFFLSEHESILDAWNESIDNEGNLWLDQDEFTYKLQVAGYDAGGPRQFQQLFQWLMPDKSTRHLHVEDMQAVLIGVPNQQKSLLWMGAKKPPPSVGHHDPVGRPLEVFRSHLARKFGCMYSGWFRGVDVARRGEVSMADFAQATLAIGFPGNMKGLYRALNKDPEDFKASVTLRDLDEEVATNVDSFAKLALADGSSFQEVWDKRLDISKTGYVEETVFVKFCKEIGYTGDAKALFKIFLPVPGRFYLFFEDFGHLSLAEGIRSPSRKREPEAWWRKEAVAELKASKEREAAALKPASPAWQANSPGNDNAMVQGGPKPARALVAESGQPGAATFELPSDEPVSTPSAEQPAKQVSATAAEAAAAQEP